MEHRLAVVIPLVIGGVVSTSQNEENLTKVKLSRREDNNNGQRNSLLILR